MRRCILVTERDGTYEMQPSAAPEDWERVVWGADHVEHIEDLSDWGEWTAAHRVQIEAETRTYFVAENEYSPEARQALVQAYGLLLELARKGRAEEDSEVEASDGEPAQGCDQPRSSGRSPDADDQALPGESEGIRSD
jgi:hypothetical protein